jgi:hypothetical protein
MVQNSVKVYGIQTFVGKELWGVYISLFISMYCQRLEKFMVTNIQFNNSTFLD